MHLLQSYLEDYVFLIPGDISVDVIKDDDGAFRHRFSRCKGNVGRNDGILRMEQGMIRIERRFFFKDIDAGTGNFTAV